MIIIHLLWFIDTVQQLFKDFITATTFPQLPAPLKIDKFVLILRKKEDSHPELFPDQNKEQ